VKEESGRAWKSFEAIERFVTNQQWFIIGLDGGW
jgi:hypothetical protein